MELLRLAGDDGFPWGKNPTSGIKKRVFGIY
jgi:hypothetical protein